MTRQLAASTQAGTERDTEKRKGYQKDDKDFCDDNTNDDDDDKYFDNDDGDVEAGGKYISWNDGERETENEDLVFEAMNVQIQLQIQI